MSVRRYRFTKRGERQLLQCSASWAQHHPSQPFAFGDEFERALRQICEHPASAPRTMSRRYENARVKVLLNTEHLVIYTQSNPDEIAIIAVLAARAMAQRP